VYTWYMPDDPEDNDPLFIDDSGSLVSANTLAVEWQGVEPAAISAVGRFDIANHSNNQLSLYVDERNRLCVRGPDGSVSYVVLSEVAPEQGAPIVPPAYYGIPAEPSEPVVVESPEPDKTLWEHLEDEGEDGQ